VETPFGEIAIEQGLPATPAEVQKLFDQLDFQQATQSYLWALPIVAFAEWQEVQEKVFGATDHDLVLYSTYADRLGILTGNATTPYLMNFFDLGRSGPMVIQRTSTAPSICTSAPTRAQASRTTGCKRSSGVPGFVTCGSTDHLKPISTRVGSSTTLN
jgi:hypothetical protein